MTHQEGNKLIAEFMGWTEFPGNMIKEKLGVAPIRVDGLKFHTSWDCLMTVVEKIENLEAGRGVYLVRIEGNYCSISIHDETEWLICESDLARTRIDAVWQTVIKFIQNV